jgi:hypothetical protein
VTAASRQSAAQKPKVQLDEYASKFASAMKLDDEFVQKAVTKED